MQIQWGSVPNAVGSYPGCVETDMFVSMGFDCSLIYPSFSNDDASDFLNWNRSDYRNIFGSLIPFRSRLCSKATVSTDKQIKFVERYEIYFYAGARASTSRVRTRYGTITVDLTMTNVIPPTGGCRWAFNRYSVCC